MQTSSPQTYFLQRPNSPKNILGSPNKNLSLTLSVGPNQTPSHILSPKPKQLLAEQQPILERLEQDLRVTAKENSILREENSQLRKELLRLKREPTLENSRSMEKLSLSPDFSDLRSTIKKEMGELRDLRARMEALTAQCHLYEETIQKMEERIRKLSTDNNKKRAEIEELQGELVRLDHLKDKTNGVVRLFNDLESKFNSEQLEWMRWKQNWLGEKQFYLNRIRQLQKAAEKYYR